MLNLTICIKCIEISIKFVTSNITVTVMVICAVNSLLFITSNISKSILVSEMLLYKM